MTQNRYVIGYVGRMNCDIIGCDDDFREVEIPKGSLVRVMSSSSLGPIDSDDDGVRYTIVKLKKSGRKDRRNVSCEGAWYGLLDPDPGVPQWTAADCAASQRQGWVISWTDGAEGHDLFELCKLEGSESDVCPTTAKVIHDRFKGGDNDAWLFVWHGAVRHQDPLAEKALAFIRFHAPDEYRKILKHCSGKLHIDG
jgi:hypothetical protein